MSDPNITRIDAAALARQIGASKGSRAARLLGLEIAQAILDGQIPEEEAPVPICICERELNAGSAKVYTGGLLRWACTCGEEWHQTRSDVRPVLGPPPGREEAGC